MLQRTLALLLFFLLKSRALAEEPPTVDGTGSQPITNGLSSDRIAEMYNFLDGDSFGIGPMHDFVYGWQSIVNTMSAKNNVEVRKRAGMQRFALAGINGISLISHVGVTEIMMNGTRTYCFGDVARPPGLKSVVCKGKMYQEGRFSCKVPFLRYSTPDGYHHCIDEFATVKAIDGTQSNAACIRGMSIPRMHHAYICERREVQIRRLNLTDVHERHNIRNPVVRRVEFYRSPNDILRRCPDWYSCNLLIAPDVSHQELNAGLINANETAFVGHGGKYWLSLYYSELSSWAVYFQPRADHIWQSSKPSTSDKGGLWKKILKANIGPDMHLHYNSNGINNRFQNTPPDLVRNEGEVLTWNMRQEEHENPDEIGSLIDDRINNDFPGLQSNNFVHDSAIGTVKARPNLQ